MKKRFISVLLTLALAASLTACGGSGNSGSGNSGAGETKGSAGTSSESTEKMTDTKDSQGAESSSVQESEAPEKGSDQPFAGETVTVYTRNVDMEGWQPFVDLVKEKTGIIVEGVVAPTNYPDVVTKLSSILTAGDDSFDIVHVDELLGVTYSTAGYLEPINEIIEAEKENYPADVLERICKSADGNYYLLPQELNAMYLFINKEVFDKAGAKIPTNTDEFLEAAKAMTNEEAYGYGAAWSKGGQLYNDLIRWMYCFEGDIYDWTKPESKEALQFMYDMLYKDKVVSEAALGDSYDAMNQKIIDNKYGMVFQWAYLADVCGDKWGDNIQIEPMPVFKTNHTIVAGWHMAINKNSKKVDAAKEVLKVWASEEGQMCNLQMEGSSHAKVMAKPEAKEVNRAGQALEEYSAAGSLVPRPMPATVNELMEVAETYAQSYLTNQMSLDECVEKATAEIQALVEE
ncbi:extracellular solute-binding protein [Robinsoniella peoriensis]|uniref:Maltose-binding periplasmic protein n=1 Tax=Robinsoniella peoriensis TaxID=180332 RepID=A0A4U8Q941_9FIRM|nr:extracellular solute-binding protein [Robinsoniella peoriensis]MDU7029478.1 extracellular solute-binding protein [Clostridiales bacterium]TLD01505.1 Maltose-binding periplasmic protein [Robinsoniella peoriensis]